MNDEPKAIYNLFDPLSLENEHALHIIKTHVNLLHKIVLGF